LFQESVTLLFRLMNLNVHALFDPPIAEEEFVNCVGNCAFR
jgi:non-SMC mitotic condensation complex subunit 1, N-term